METISRQKTGTDTLTLPQLIDVPTCSIWSLQERDSGKSTGVNKMVLKIYMMEASLMLNPISINSATMCTGLLRMKTGMSGHSICSSATNTGTLTWPQTVGAKTMITIWHASRDRRKAAPGWTGTMVASRNGTIMVRTGAFTQRKATKLSSWLHHSEISSTGQLLGMQRAPQTACQLVERWTPCAAQESL